mgnify:CR=1 FL=1
MSKRVLICGDRNWTDGVRILNVLHDHLPCEVVISGTARGADSLGEAAASTLEIPVLRFPAEWEKYGRAAGPIRNQQMLTEGKPDIVLAFHDNIVKSKGTADMIKRAMRAGLKVYLNGYALPLKPR